MGGSSVLFNRTNLIHYTTFVSRRLNILCTMYNTRASLQLRCLSAYVWGWAFYSHAENIYMTVSFHLEGRFRLIAHSVNPATFHWSAWRIQENEQSCFACKGYRFCLFLWFFFLILELFWKVQRSDPMHTLELLVWIQGIFSKVQ